MIINRRMTKSIAVAPAVAVLAAGAFAAGQPAGARTVTGQECTTTQERGYPDVVPPILPPPPCSALAMIRREEALETQAFRYVPPAGPYSDAEFTAYASVGSYQSQ